MTPRESTELGAVPHQLETVDTTTVYVVEDLFPDTAICQLSAQYKIGKTTLVTNLMYSLATGEPFLRRFRVKFAGNIAHWNMEVSQNTLLGWYRKNGMPEEALEKCFPLSVRGNLSLDFNNETVVQWAIAWLQDNNIQAWIIDPLSKLYRDDENSSTAFNQWWLRLEHIAREAGLKLVMVVHHTGHANDRSRGTSAMMGNPDVLLSYTHSGNLGDNPPNNLRYLTALGRDVDLPSTEIDWEPETNTLFCTNSGTTRVQAKSTVKAREAGVVVWNADDRLKTGDLYKRLKWRQDGRTATENARAIERAVAKGYITQERDGRTVWNARGSVDPRAGQDSQK
ncbi:AAA family ATPase [Mycobacterium intracellulare]|uniref:AAA family ATPase n=1 Tax=Mycobacterium intracellulare TaxID=1767 RepID=UPI0022778D18|nr:AAA family ATPase [Mycobacterium intracellulare]